MTVRRIALSVAVGLFALAPTSPAGAAAPPADSVKVIARDGAGGAERELRARGAVRGAVDYGSFRLLLVDEQAAGGRAALAARGLEIRDDMNFVLLGASALDTRRPGNVEGRLRGWERRAETAAAKAQRRAPGDGLYLVQFVGPVRPEWVAALRDAGLDLVSYVPENAYVVRAEGAARKRLQNLEAADEHVQYVGDFHPVYRVSDELHAATSSGEGGVVEVVVQVIDGPRAQGDLADLRALADSWRGSHQVGGFHNAALAIDARRLAQVAAKEYVFHIEPRTPKGRLDEAQGQILAGNLLGNLPSGPGYLTWLDGKGFNAGQFAFAVNVVDDAYALSGHPDLAGSRIAFENNPTSQTGAQGGHGFLNAHIIGGFNTGTGTAVEDASGYNYGLGIAPYAKLGATAIFGSGASTPTAWESSAYGAGARISSNSWGFTGTAARRYDSNAQEFDVIVRDAQSGVAGSQPLSVVFAAGNDGSGANTVASPGTAKNVITAGAGENVRQTGTDGCAVANTGADSANDVIDFSSRGPVNSTGGDGRVKPDIMAPGTHIEAGVPQSNYDGSSICNQYWPSGQTLYGWSSGTSHSTPAIAGAAALVYQDFLNKGRPAPTPAMVKAYLMSSTTHMTGVGANDTLPSNNQGMGRMSLGRAFDSAQRVLVDQTTVLGSSGETYTASGTVGAASGGLRVTLAWSDAAGPTTGAPWVNNLDLEVTVGGITYKGNVFSGASSISGGTADAKNNAESVFLPAASGSYTVTVRGTTIAGNGVPGNADTTDQDFALVIGNATTGAPVDPTIAVSPASMSFSGVAGGAGPAGQSLTISNTGGGTLNWTASDNAAWLSVSPSSGTAPSTTSVAVSTAGLAAGTYNGTITITATGATNSPVNVPVTLTVAPETPIGELIANGGFEGSASPWALSGSAFWTGTGAYPRTGTGHAYLGNANSVSGEAYQTVSIPSNATTADLRFWLNVTSAETTTSTQYDKLFVEVRNSAGTLLSTLATFSNLNKATAGVYTQRGAYNLLAYKGQTLRVQFRATTDSSLITTFRVDDVSLAAGSSSASPTIAVSPASMSFSGVAGGAGPAGQSLAISNTGGGTLNWTASDNAAWLSVSPSSGTAPSTTSVSASTAGLAAGTYNGTITITATGATNSPLTVPVTLTVTAAPADLIANGGFEGSASPWALSGSAFWTGTSSYPHGGAGYAYLGNANSVSGQAYQTVSIPSTASTANLTFWLNATSSETTTTTQYDKLFVEVRSSTGTLLSTLATFSNLNNATAGVYTQRGAYSLLAYKGLAVRVQFRATTDSSLPTIFRLDDVSLK